jgi:hypothetical protein
MHIYEVRPRKDHCGVVLISDALPFGRLWYGQANAISNAIGYAMHRSRSHDAVIRVYDDASNLIETHEKAISKSGNFILPRLGLLLCRKYRTITHAIVLLDPEAEHWSEQPN